MAIQRGNAQCVMGCVEDKSSDLGTSGLEGLFNFQVVHEAASYDKKNLYIFLYLYHLLFSEYEEN